MPPPPHLLPSFVRKDSLKRPKLEEHFSSRSQLSLAQPSPSSSETAVATNTNTGGPISASAPAESNFKPRRKGSRKGSIVSFADLSSSNEGGRSSSPTPPSNTPPASDKEPGPSSGFGWGKIIREGTMLSVSTLVGGLKVGSSSSNNTSSTAKEVKEKEQHQHQPLPIKRLDSTTRLAELRALMIAEPDGGLDYYIVPSEDAHQSEYTAPPDRRREFISGFTGSSGTAIVSRSAAHLFTDSRYWIQATRELDSNWTLHKVGVTGIQPWNEWLKERPRGSRVGIDSRLISHERATQLSSALSSRYSKLVFPRVNLVDKVWKGRPPKKADSPAFFLDIKFTGRTASEKLDDLRTWIRSMRPLAPPVSAGQKVKAGTAAAKKDDGKAKDKDEKEKGVKSADGGAKAEKPAPPAPKPPMAPVATFISSLASIAWLLNIRGHDIHFNPVVISYLFVTTKQAILFVDRQKLTPEVSAYLKDQGVSVREYADVWAFLRRAEWGDGKVLIDKQTPYAVSLMLTSARYMLYPGTSYVDGAKAIKNSTEVEGFRNAYKRDGAAYVKWLAWLEEQIKNGFELTEWQAAEELTHLREENVHYWGLAYENISASGPNAALPHYAAGEETAAVIDTSTPYLNDSGGQYYDGTCDTTRTLHFGFPTNEQMEAYTRVLQGHIAIDTAVFPAGTTGHQLDVLARKSLWKDGLNYMHGTGHGIGAFLNVHEGPHSFSSDVPLEPGMVISNEPGFYKEGAFGIRIESALLVKKVDLKHSFGGDWYGFERLTQVPIQMRMVKMDMLSKEEKAWLKGHNATVRDKLAPLLGEDKRAMRYVRRESTKASPSSGVVLEWD